MKNGKNLESWLNNIDFLPLFKIVAVITLLLSPSLVFAQYCAQGVVSRVIDGDTLEISCATAKHKLRMLGVDTPETVHPKKSVECYGPEASTYSKKSLTGRHVALKYQKSKTDKYGRALAYVYVGKRLFNLELIRKGYARAYTRFPLDYKERFVAAEEYAKSNKLGLWGQCVSKSAVPPPNRPKRIKVRYVMIP